MSTKKQVSRKRQVIEVPEPERRDPRFSSVSAGHANADLHSKSYSFLPDLLRQEFSGLKEAVAAAKKAEKNCSWAEKPMKTAERERLEVQMGQVRTKLVRTEKESMEREILAKAKKEEREKRTQGKGAWYMKKGESPECRCIFKLTGNQQARKKTCFSKRVSRHSRNKGGRQRSKSLWRRRGRSLRARRKRVGPLRKEQREWAEIPKNEESLKHHYYRHFIEFLYSSNTVSNIHMAHYARPPIAGHEYLNKETVSLMIASCNVVSILCRKYSCTVMLTGGFVRPNESFDDVPESSFQPKVMSCHSCIKRHPYIPRLR